MKCSPLSITSAKNKGRISSSTYLWYLKNHASDGNNNWEHPIEYLITLAANIQWMANMMEWGIPAAQIKILGQIRWYNMKLFTNIKKARICVPWRMNIAQLILFFVYPKKSISNSFRAFSHNFSIRLFFFGSLETLGKYCSGLERSGIKPRNNIGKEWPFIRNSISPRIVCIHEKRRTVGARYLYHAYLESFLYKRSMELAECTNRVQFKAQILVILWRIDFHNSYGITSKSCSATFEIDIFQNNMKCNLRWK